MKLVWISSTCLLVWIALLGPSTAAFSVNSSDDLIATLLTGYSTKSRPSSTVHVDTAFQMTATGGVDVKSGTFAVVGWWIIRWNDSRLAWTPSDAGNISALVMYQIDIWTPSLVVSNSQSDLSAIDDSTIPLRISSDGNVVWRPPGIIFVSCDVDITYFPFDNQICYIEVTSFGYSIQEVNLTSSDGLAIEYYSRSGEWSIAQRTISRLEYEDGNLDYARLTFGVILTRKSTFYGLNMIFPVVVTGMLIMFVFLVPAESGEKLSFALTLHLALVVLLTLVASSMPTTSQHTSFLEIYISLILGLSVVAVMLAICVLQIHYLDEGRRKVPGWVKNMTYTCQRLCCHGNHPNGDNGTMVHPLQPESSGDNLKNRLSQTIVDQEGRNFSFENILQRKEPRQPLQSDYQDTVMPPVPGAEIVRSQDVMQWKTVAHVMDSVMLRLYALLVPGITLGFILAITIG